MILRTYARRSREAAAAAAPDSSESEDEEKSRFPLSQESYGSLLDDLCLASSSSQDDRRWRDDGAATTATLMEAQECGEMMEHMDEVNFALDGLHQAQPVRVRRASLLSLLTICAGAHQRRLLRAQGTMKRIIDAVLDLNFDDSSSTIASAALFYILASDVQDDLLLESPECIQFLIKLLKPPSSDGVRDKALSIGSRLMLIRPPELKNGLHKRLDSGSMSIILKVQEILLHCKEIKPPEHDEVTERPELTSKWIGLLTMEKACLSTVSFEDISGSTQKVGGYFKEKLREFGGLDTVIDIAITCYSNMEEFLKQKASTTDELKGILSSENILLFLKCLKIMENATFLSKENQNHLLQVTMKFDRESGLSCVEFVIRAIKFFSGLLLSQGSISNPQNPKFSHALAHATANSISQTQFGDECQENQSRILSSSSAGCSGVLQSPPLKSFEAPSKRQRLSQSKQGHLMQISDSTFGSGSLEKKVDGTTSVLCKSEADNQMMDFYASTNESKGNHAKGVNKWISINATGSKLGNSGSSSSHFSNSSGSNANSVCVEKPPNEYEDCLNRSPDGHFDPFAFDEDELEPSKWDSLTVPKKIKQSQRSTQTFQTENVDKHLEDQIDQCRSTDKALGDSFNCQGADVDKAVDDGFENISSCNGLVNDKDHHLNEEPSPATDGDSCLVEDCLLTAVKVLINLTNDNVIGCQQIGSYGGLDTMVSLIVNHFPAFGSGSCQVQEIAKWDDNNEHPNRKRLTDHELDFLVAILGLLVNLVEKDSINRSKLVCTRISCGELGRAESCDNAREVIHLLCSIFLVNQGPEQVKKDGETSLPRNDEAALLQGEREAEMMIIEAYAALLLAFLSKESKKAWESIAGCLPSRNLKILVPVLERFVEFHLSLNMITPETHIVVSEVIESCRIP